MRTKCVLILSLCIIAATVNAQTRKMIDLTYSFSSETIYWPNTGGFVLNKDADRMTEKGYFYASNSYSAGEHGGTHFDAPRHFAQAMPTVEQIPLERLFAPAFVIDVQDKAQ